MSVRCHTSGPRIMWPNVQSYLTSTRNQKSLLVQAGPEESGKHKTLTKVFYIPKRLIFHLDFAGVCHMPFAHKFRDTL